MESRRPRTDTCFKRPLASTTRITQAGNPCRKRQTSNDVDQPKYNSFDEVDFVIIGSGAAGGILAKELSTNGFRVLF